MIVVPHMWDNYFLHLFQNVKLHSRKGLSRIHIFTLYKLKMAYEATIGGTGNNCPMWI